MAYENFCCELDAEFTHCGNLFRVQCNDYNHSDRTDASDISECKVFVYLPLTINNKKEMPGWIQLDSSDSENFTDDFWEVAIVAADKMYDHFVDDVHGEDYE